MERRDFSPEEWHVLDATSEVDAYFVEIRSLGSHEQRPDEAARVVLDLFHRGLVDIKRDKPKRRRRRSGREMTAAEAEQAILDLENWHEPKSDWFMVSATAKGEDAYARAVQEREAEASRGLNERSTGEQEKRRRRSS